MAHSETGERVPDALVILQSSSLQGSRETLTNDNGVYAFRDLPAGTYTIQVLSGRAAVAKVTTLPDGAKFRASFTLDPDDDGIVCRLPARVRPALDVSLFSITDVSEARLLGVPRTIYR